MCLHRITTHQTCMSMEYGGEGERSIKIAPAQA